MLLAGIQLLSAPWRLRCLLLLLPLLKVAERSARQGVRLVGVPLPSAVAGSKGRLGNLLRKAGAAVKQGSGAIVASIKQAGASQQEEAVMAG